MPERSSTPSSDSKMVAGRRSLPSLESKSLSERKFSSPGTRLPTRQSLNSRLGAHGPTAAFLPKSEKSSPKSAQDLEDFCVKLESVSVHSTPGGVYRKSFNERLVKVRDLDIQSEDSNGSIKFNESINSNDTDLADDSCVNESVLSIKSDLVEKSGNESVVSNRLEPGKENGNKSLDELISNFIKEERDFEDCKSTDLNETPLSAESFTTDYTDSCVNKNSCVTVSEIMSKRDFLGNVKEGRESTNFYKRRSNLDEDVVQEETISKVQKETILKVEEKVDVTPKQNKINTILQSRHSDIYQPRRSESPQSSAEKLSRNDYPVSFGSGGKGGKRRSLYDSDIVEEVEKYFSKRYYLSRKNDWELPNPSQLFSSEPWEVEELLECKAKLNTVKEKLDFLDLRSWHAHTKKRNKAGLIVWKLRKSVNPEFPTQAWCKFYENLCTFNLIPNKCWDEKKLNSVHLCEAPGAFITSLNHYIRTNADDFEWNWLGTTLNPHYEGNPLSLMINEDRFILHTMDHWTFGEDHTGDLMNIPNLDDLIKRTNEMGEVMLVTADGSFDCQDDPAEQENVVAWLHYCEAISALMILGKGGNFLVKVFTVFEHMTISLLYFLSCVFEEVAVNKPATSKEGNSETYVVCKNYVGKSEVEPWLSKCFENYGPNRPRKAMFPREVIPDEFLERVIECAETFREYQTDIIEANLRTFKEEEELERSKNEQTRRAVQNEFFRRYELKELPEKYDIVGRDIINSIKSYNMDPRMETGTFNDKIKRKEVPDRQKILDLKEDLEVFDRRVLEKWPADKAIWWYTFDSDPDYDLSKEIKIVTGKPVKHINSSKFCLGRLLNIRNNVREIVLNCKACSKPCFNRATEELEVPNNTCQLDFKNTLWTSSDKGLIAEEEFRAFQIILKHFDKLSRDDNLVIYGYPLLTQFNVGLVYLLAHSFHRVGIMKPKGQNFGIIFEKHDISSKKLQVKDKLDEIAENIQPLGKTVLAMLPIQKLCKGLFYKYVTMANNICVKEQVYELIDEYLKATESKSDREKRRWTTS